MQRLPLITSDGSHTIQVQGTELTYHSRHGAVAESMHVFIAAGLHNWCSQNPGQPLILFEMGFGTGLNALLTAVEAEKRQTPVHYFSVEAEPLEQEIIVQLNYTDQIQDTGELFAQIQNAAWNEDVPVHPYFFLHKIKGKLNEISLPGSVDLIYYDAFAPSAQPELWTQSIFEKLFAAMKPGGILVTYCSKSDVRRAMQAAGFIVEKIPGPPHKREMLRAGKKGMNN